jgi:hypothetical protein
VLGRGVIEIDPIEPRRLDSVSPQTVNQRQGLPFLRGSRGPMAIGCNMVIAPG